MTLVVARLLSTDDWMEFSIGKFDASFDKIAFVKSARYAEKVMLSVGVTGEEAAEAVFDISNNPAREAERSEVWGRRRSLSVGDIVETYDNGVKTIYLCDSVGWTVVE